MPNKGDRFYTGDKNPANAVYVFDGYTDGKHGQRPDEESRTIRLEKGKTFPRIQWMSRGAWWKLEHLT